jgi:hypothetical protein
MTLADFDREMKPLEERWKSAFPNPVRTRIYSFVRDLGPISFQRIVRSMLDTQRVAPLPKDFLEAAGNERKKSFDRKPTQEFKPIDPNCHFCGDLGVIKAIGEDFNELMMCECNESDDYRAPKNTWKIPTWSREYRREKCPKDWFVPDKGSDLIGAIQNKAELWKARIEIAEQFWHQRLQNERNQAQDSIA